MADKYYFIFMGAYEKSGTNALAQSEVMYTADKKHGRLYENE